MSIQATPVTRLVLTSLGRQEGGVDGREAVDRAPDGCHWPSPGVGVGHKGRDGRRCGQVGRPGRLGGRGGGHRGGNGALWGLPPLGGACQVYQVFSAQVTRPPPPWSRTHSVRRAPGVVPSAWLVAAMAARSTPGSGPQEHQEHHRLRMPADQGTSPASSPCAGPGVPSGSAAASGGGRGAVPSVGARPPPDRPEDRGVDVVRRRTTVRPMAPLSRCSVEGLGHRPGTASPPDHPVRGVVGRGAGRAAPFPVVALTLQTSSAQFRRRRPWPHRTGRHRARFVSCGRPAGAPPFGLPAGRPRSRRWSPRPGPGQVRPV